MLQPLNRKTARITADHPVKVLQFGEGNFLRAFADWIVDILNEKTAFNGSVQIVQPIEQGMAGQLTEQDGLYHVWLRGLQNGEPVDRTRLITAVRGAVNPYLHYQQYLKLAENPDLQFIISNTTEAGIAFDAGDTSYERIPNSFPAKLAAFLFRRFRHFNRRPPDNLIVIPCELIDRNGTRLKDILLQYAGFWNLDEDFKSWVARDIVFCNTLVDRIVPGHPGEKAGEIEQRVGYRDKMIVAAEYFHLWVIEAPAWIQELFPVDKAGLNVTFVDDQTPYRTRKVRILNGLHTTMVPVSYLCGLETVRDAVTDEVVGSYLKQALNAEIIPTLDLPERELNSFADAVFERFRNPFVEHRLLSIALNAISKYKVRVLPSVLEYIRRKGELPDHLLFSLAALIRFYKGDWKGQAIPLKDDQETIRFIQDAWGTGDYLQVTRRILGRVQFWDQDLSAIDHLSDRVALYLNQIDEQGMKAALGALMD